MTDIRHDGSCPSPAPASSFPPSSYPEEGNEVIEEASKVGPVDEMHLYDVGHKTMAILALETALNLIDEDELRACMYAGLAKSCVALYCTERERLRAAREEKP